jgi:cell fate (sporulation/competence/biofilm development) regulator YmcA (YheA/YmcA/DUF963 family)
MTLPEAVEFYKAARQEVHEAMDARDAPRLMRALEAEAMWERICDKKRATPTTAASIDPLMASVANMAGPSPFVAMLPRR